MKIGLENKEDKKANKEEGEEIKYYFIFLYYFRIFKTML